MIYTQKLFSPTLWWRGVTNGTDATLEFQPFLVFFEGDTVVILEEIVFLVKLNTIFPISSPVCDVTFSTVTHMRSVGSNFFKVGQQFFFTTGVAGFGVHNKKELHPIIRT